MRKYVVFVLLTTVLVNISFAQEKTKSMSDFPVLEGKYLGQKEPGLTPELFAPDIVSTKAYNDRDLTISPDGNQLFFARTKTGKKDDYNYNIMYSEKLNGIWTEPEIAWFSSEYGDVEAFFTPDGNELFFNSNRPPSGDGEKVDWETWYMIKDSDDWSSPKLLGTPFNRVCHTTFSQNGKMYYTKEDETILYRTTYNDGVFGEPEKLASIINSTKVQYNCFISKEESYLIFTSRLRKDGFGSGDLFISFRNNKDEWSEPINLGPEINSDGHESSPSISPDGKYFFFTSNRGGNNDVYWVSIKKLDELKN